jgi:ankyrin repeat protein
MIELIFIFFQLKGQTPLMLACSKAYVEIVALLVERGARRESCAALAFSNTADPSDAHKVISILRGNQSE